MTPVDELEFDLVWATVLPFPEFLVEWLPGPLLVIRILPPVTTQVM